MDDLSRRLVPDELWALAEPLIPEHGVRPQGGGPARVDDREVFTAIVFVLTRGCAWRYLPPSFGVTVPPAHRVVRLTLARGSAVGAHRRLGDGSRSLLVHGCQGRSSYLARSRAVQGLPGTRTHRRSGLPASDQADRVSSVALKFRR
ncbi:transposase [Amycolatopsis sp. DSM 110486]|nr:transposase [Amycolatopsis sp. DSM 110486]